MSKLAILGGKAVRTKPWPGWPVWDDGEKKALIRVLESGSWCRVPRGTEIPKFEKEFAKWAGAKHCLAVSSGTAALEIALKALGIGPGDEVIVPAYTFVATASSVANVSAVPVFADVEEDTGNIDPKSVEKCVTRHTRAIMPVHLSGYPADMDAIGKVAKKHKLKIIEDACQAAGGEWRGRKLGTIGDAGAFSFQESKVITAGDGGAVLTNSTETYERAFALHHIGRRPSSPTYEHEMLAWNYRITEFQAAILRVQLKRLPSQTRKRAANCLALFRELDKIDGVRPSRYRDERVTVRACYYARVLYDPGFYEGIPRDVFCSAMNREGIVIHGSAQRPLYTNPMFTKPELWNRGWPLKGGVYKGKVDYRKVHCPVTERLIREISMTLGKVCFQGARSDVKDIADAFAKVAENKAALLDWYRRKRKRRKE